MPKKLTKEQFIKKSARIHKNKYDYSEVVYVDALSKVNIKCNRHGVFQQKPSEHMHGYGCKLCANENNKNSKSEFIIKAVNIHGDKYTYDNFVYVTYKTKGTITCKIHGNFLQTPKAHISAKQGCPTCGGRAQSSTTAFIDKATLIHGNIYDYTEVNYTKAHNKIKIICKMHGAFQQTASEHLKGYGCRLCGQEHAQIKNALTQEQFIQKAKKVHKDRYDYSSVNYINQTHKIKIICKIHGAFQQTPSDHTSAKAGCPICGGRMQDTNESFIKKAIATHGTTYDYSKIDYVKSCLKICIGCPEHGDFLITPRHHLRGGRCPKCVLTESKSISRKEKQWLEFMNVPNTPENRQVKLPIDGFHRKRVDGFMPETNTVYEFYGDYWHGNPNVYSSSNINKTNHLSFGELFEKTMIKRQKILDAGYKLIEIWESEWDETNRK